jgi:hypothetical protein
MGPLPAQRQKLRSIDHSAASPPSWYGVAVRRVDELRARTSKFPTLVKGSASAAFPTPPSPRTADTKSPGRSPGLGFSLGPAFPLAQWHDGPSSPDTVAGQRRNLTGFPNTGCGLNTYSRRRPQSTGARTLITTFDAGLIGGECLNLNSE